MPLIGCVRAITADALGPSFVAYTATAVFEEGLWRGVMLGIVRPTGVRRAVLISSLLFGLGPLAEWYALC